MVVSWNEFAYIITHFFPNLRKSSRVMVWICTNKMFVVSSHINLDKSWRTAPFLCRNYMTCTYCLRQNFGMIATERCWLRVNEREKQDTGGAQQYDFVLLMLLKDCSSCGDRRQDHPSLQAFYCRPSASWSEIDFENLAYWTRSKKWKVPHRWSHLLGAHSFPTSTYFTFAI